MRVSGVLFAILFVTSFNPAYVSAQGDETRRADDEQAEPYHKHRDTRHGHDHVYPDRGAILRDVPRGATRATLPAINSSRSPMKMRK